MLIWHMQGCRLCLVTLYRDAAVLSAAGAINGPSRHNSLLEAAALMYQQLPDSQPDTADASQAAKQ